VIKTIRDKYDEISVKSTLVSLNLKSYKFKTLQRKSGGN